MVIGKRIKDRRIELGFSQSKLGELLGVSKVAVSGYENNTKTPSLAVFIKLLDALKVDPNELIGRDIMIVSSTDEDYTTKLAKQDLEIISELKTKSSLYNMLYEDPKRTIELIDRKIK